MILPEYLKETKITLDLFFRRSSDDDTHQVESIPSQESRVIPIVNGLIKQYPNIKIGKIFHSSHSAKEPGNPDFIELVERLKAGESNAVAAWELTRFSRNPMDSGTLSWLLQREILKFILTPQRVYLPEDNVLLMSVEFGMANQFIRDLSRNVKRGLQNKAEKGWLPSGAKAGYMNDKFTEKGSKTIIKDPIRFPLIRKVWEHMLTGLYSPPKIHKLLNDEWGYRTPKHKKIGGKPMSLSAIYYLFTDSFYYGEFEYPTGSGNWFHGKHEPMITKDEFERVQMLLGRKGKPVFNTHFFPYTGPFRCGECNARITAEEKWQIICPVCKTKFHKGKTTDSCSKCKTLIENMVNPNTLHYIYYHCTKRKNPSCTQGAIQVDDLESGIDKILEGIEISERFKNWAIKYINKMNDNEVGDRNLVLTSLQTTYNDCVKRLDNLVKLKISPQNSDNSLLSDEEFKDQKNSLIREKAGIEERLNHTGNRINKWVDEAEKAFDFACYARYWLKNGDPQKKREIFYGLGQNVTLKDRIVSVKLEKPLNAIKELKKEVPSISPMFEPEKEGLTTAQLEALWTQNPSVLPRVDSNHEP